MNINSVYIKLPLYIIYYFVFHFLLRETYFICSPVYDNYFYNDFYQMTPPHTTNIGTNVKNIYDFNVYNIFGKFELLMECWEILLVIILYQYYIM